MIISPSFFLTKTRQLSIFVANQQKKNNNHQHISRLFLFSSKKQKEILSQNFSQGNSAKHAYFFSRKQRKFRLVLPWLELDVPKTFFQLSLLDYSGHERANFTFVDELYDRRQIFDYSNELTV